MIESVEVYKCVIVRESTVEYEATGCNAVLDIAKAIGMLDAAEEYMYLLCLDSRLQVIGIHQVSHGGISSAMVPASSVMKRVILNNSEKFILVHNHPSGIVSPSPADRAATQSMVQVAKLLGLQLIDHVIVGFPDNYYSFEKEGLL